MLERLWLELSRAETRQAPEGCSGLVRVPFGIEPAWFRQEFLLRISGVYRPRAGETIEPFVSPERALRYLRDADRIRSHHLSCCGGQEPGAADGAVSVNYLRHGLRHWIAMPGVTYAATGAGSAILKNGRLLSPSYGPSAEPALRGPENKFGPVV